MNQTKLLSLIKDELNEEDGYGRVMDVFTDAFYKNQYVSDLLKALSDDQKNQLVMKLFERYANNIDLYGILQWGIDDTCVGDSIHNAITSNTVSVISLIKSLGE